MSSNGEKHSEGHEGSHFSSEYWGMIDQILVPCDTRNANSMVRLHQSMFRDRQDDYKRI